MGEKNKKPNIRFKKFTEDWESQKLDDIVSITMGQSPNGNTYTRKKSDYILVQGNADLQNGWVEPRVWTTQKTKTANAGDLILSVRAPAGAIGKTKYDVVIGRGVAAIKGNEFIYQKLYKMNEDGYWTKFSCGSTFDSINSDSINSAEIMIPSEEEQNQIGLFFKNIDKVIEKCQNEFKSLQNIKKSLLQKMFPENNEDKPKVRFKGFTDAWEQRKLESLTNKYGSGGTPLSTNPSFYGGKIPFLSISDLTNSDNYIFDTEKHITDIGLKSSAAWVVPAESISLAMYASVGKVAILKNDIATSQAFFNFTINENYNRNFVFYYLKKMEEFEKWTSLISTGTQPNLNAEKVKNLDIIIPKDLKEQESIGKIFEYLDSLITLHQRKYEKLQNIKKSLLERMFI